MSETKAMKARNLRYKRPALKSLGYDQIVKELNEMSEACSDVRWFTEDNEALVNALDGDEDEAYEFRLAFSDLDYKAERLLSELSNWNIQEEFDNCTVALIGNRYRALGYDAEEEDYFSLTMYEQELAHTESGKKIMRYTKSEMLALIGQCIGSLVAFLDLRQSYDYLKATFDILRDDNNSILQVIRDIEKAYEEAQREDFCVYSNFEKLTENLPERYWIE